MKNFLIVASGIYLIAATILVGGSLLLGLKGAADVQGPMSPGTIAVIMLPLLLWTGATGVGIILRRNWARISLNLIAGFVLAVGFVSVLMFLLMPLPTEAESARPFIVGLLVVFELIVPGFLLIFFNHTSTRALYVRSDEPSKREFLPGLPLGFKLIVVYYLVGVAGTLIGFFNPAAQSIPMVFGPWLIAGAGIQIYLTAWMGLSLFIALAVTRLMPAGWWALMIQNGFIVGLTLLNLIFFTPEMHAEILAAMNLPQPDQSIPFSFYRFSMLLGCILPVAILVYGYLKRHVFLNPLSEA